jgi:hypothetical protein
MSVDPFAAAAGASDTAFTDGFGDMMIQELGSIVVSDPLPSQPSLHMVRKRRRACRSTEKSSVPSAGRVRSNPVTSRLVRVDPSTDDTVCDNKWLTLMLPQDRQKPKNGSHPDRQKPMKGSHPLEYTPITVWPQYTVEGIEGTFVVCSPSEMWMDVLLHTLRPKTTTSISAKAMRSLVRGLQTAMRTVLRSGLQQHRKDGQHADDAESSDDGMGAKKRVKPRNFSGFKLDKVFLIKINVAGAPLTIVNYGMHLIVQVDDDAMHFMRSCIPDIIRKLSVSDAPDEIVPTPSTPDTGFKFDDDTPNIRGKIVWEPDRNGWRVTMTRDASTCTTFKEQSGASLIVPDGLTAYDHDNAKRTAYTRAIATWNAMDQSKRHRIQAPVKITLNTSTGSPSTPSTSSATPITLDALFDGSPPSVDADVDPFMTLAPPTMYAKWRDDCGL